MKIYISGKISGLPINEARSNFSICEVNLSNLGYNAVNPMSKKYWWNRIGKLPWAVHMTFDIILLSRCNGIVFQKNWKDSRGAKIERMVAKLFGIKTMDKAMFFCKLTPLPREEVHPMGIGGARVILGDRKFTINDKL